MIRWICTLALVIAPGLSEAQSLFGSAARSESMFQDRRAQRAQRIGDILTVLVVESTSASNTAVIDTEKNATINWTAPGGLKIPGFGLAGTATNSFEGEGTTSRQQTITARVSVSVVDVRPNGDLVIEGSRVIDINGESEIIYLSGSVNPFIIPATNTIESFRIADLQVSYKGKGVISEGTRPGVVIRFLNWVF